ncbi:MAG TPA: TrkA C-terminal domain-containing protein, partial [Denitromonas sp.]|nr:TrkA C-terminal domain-containing protein [Denitromonas sp.]
VGRSIEDIRLPRGATIGAVVRLEGATEDSPGRPAVLMAHHDTVIEPEDHLIVFCTSKKLVRQVEKLFQVDFSFF